MALYANQWYLQSENGSVQYTIIFLHFPLCICTKILGEIQMSSSHIYWKTKIHQFNGVNRLTSNIYGVILWPSIKTWIDRGAVHISIPVSKGTGSPAGRKGSPPKFFILPGDGMLGRRRISAGLSHVFVKRYHGVCQDVCMLFCVFPWIALRAIHFLCSGLLSVIREKR